MMNDQDDHESGISPLSVRETINSSTNQMEEEEEVETIELKRRWDQQHKYALDRVKAVQTRPSTVAADEFFSSDVGGGRGTTTQASVASLPFRLNRLTQALESWVRSFRNVCYGNNTAAAAATTTSFASFTSSVLVWLFRALDQKDPCNVL
jgi:hypothetical protein